MARHVTSGLLHAVLIVLLVGGVGLAWRGGLTGLPAAGAPTSLPECSADAGALAAAAQEGTTVVKWRAEGVDDADGGHAGYRLHVPMTSGDEIEITLAAETVLGRQVGALLLYSSDTPETGSDIHAIDVRTGCDSMLLEPTEVVRAVTIDQAGEYLYVKRVSRDTRADLGIWRYAIGHSEGVMVAEPMPESDFGPVWSTTLTWSEDGAALAIDACGQGSCQTRVVDTASGTVSDYFGEHGPLIALTGKDLLSYADPENRPVDIIAIDRASGVARTVAHDAYKARAKESGDGLLVETSDGVIEVKP